MIAITYRASNPAICSTAAETAASAVLEIKIANQENEVPRARPIAARLTPFQPGLWVYADGRMRSHRSGSRSFSLQLRGGIAPYFCSQNAMKG